MMTTQWWKSFSGGLVALVVCLSAPTTSAQVNTCTNVQVSTLNAGTLIGGSGVYSDCALDVGGTPRTPAIFYDGLDNRIKVDYPAGAAYGSLPAQFVVGTADNTLLPSLAILQPGTSDCASELYGNSQSEPPAPLTYCARFPANDAGGAQAVYITATWDATNSVFTNASVVYNFPAAGSSSSSGSGSGSAATAVPTLPLFGVMLLGGLLGLFGLRKLKQ